jgi:hypothetical protein
VIKICDICALVAYGHLHVVAYRRFASNKSQEVYIILSLVIPGMTRLNGSFGCASGQTDWIESVQIIW